MAWILLFLAGLFEVAWAIGLKYTEGFTRPIPSVLTLTAMVISVVLLVGLLNYVPALALEPVVEHLMLGSAK